MGFWSRRVLPRLINCSCGVGAISKERAAIVPQAEGAVLELGFGSGLNLAFYDASKVRRIVGVEPEAGMVELGRAAAAKSAIPVEIVDQVVERAGLAPAQFDTLVVTFTLCTIPDAEAALRAAAGLLKPGGRLLFCEHGLAADAKVRQTQRRLEPLWRRMAGGCRLTKHIPSVVRDGGFQIDTLHAGYMKRAPQFAGYVYRGVARAA